MEDLIPEVGEAVSVGLVMLECLRLEECKLVCDEPWASLDDDNDLV